MKLPLRAGAAARVGDTLTLGLRPEHIELGSAAPIGLNVRADYVENLGGSSQLHAQTVSNEAVTVQAPGRHEVRRGDTVALSVQPQHAYLFNAAGQAL